MHDESKDRIHLHGARAVVQYIHQVLAARRENTVEIDRH